MLGVVIVESFPIRLVLLFVSLDFNRLFDTTHMIDTDCLFLIASDLKADATSTRALATQLRELYYSEPYQNWAGSLSERNPFILPVDFDDDVLSRFSFARDRRLLVKLNIIGTRIFVTDGVWVDPRVRVFPFCDESSSLLHYVNQQGLADWADIVIDLATGCGHSIISYSGTAQRLAFDINPRALSYVVINQLLNAVTSNELTTFINDIRDGIPKIVAPKRGQRILFLANMPFAPAPAQKEVPLTTNGGKNGMDFQVATFKAIRDFVARVDCEVRACMLGVTPGKQAEDSWILVDEAREYFGPHQLTWRLLPNEKIFRVDGVRELDNPSPILNALSRLGSCGLYYDDSEKPRVQAAFEDVGKALQSEGCPDIAYGIVEYGSPNIEWHHR